MNKVIIRGKGGLEIPGKPYFRFFTFFARLASVCTEKKISVGGEGSIQKRPRHHTWDAPQKNIYNMEMYIIQNVS